MAKSNEGRARKWRREKRKKNVGRKTKHYKKSIIALDFQFSFFNSFSSCYSIEFFFGHNNETWNVSHDIPLGTRVSEDCEYRTQSIKISLNDLLVFCVITQQIKSVLSTLQFILLIKLRLSLSACLYVYTHDLVLMYVSRFRNYWLCIFLQKSPSSRTWEWITITPPTRENILEKSGSYIVVGNVIVAFEIKPLSQNDCTHNKAKLLTFLLSQRLSFLCWVFLNITFDDCLSGYEWR